MEKDRELTGKVVESSQVSDGDGFTWTEEEEQAIRWKIDLRIMPMVCVVYWLCFMDRVNIGNARVIGMGKELKLDGYKFNWTLTIFYIVYACVEVPSNLVLKRVGARIWMPVLVAGFGTVTMSMAFVVNFRGLLVARAFLGLMEGGTLPGISFYLSQFYRRSELLIRLGIWLSTATIAGAFGGLLATGLSKIPEWGVAGARLHSWRNIFFFEGLLTILIGVLAPLGFPPGPGSCSFLNERESKIAVQRLAKELQTDREEKVTGTHIKMATLNVMNCICAAGFLLANISLTSISLFMPTILNQMGYGPIASQLHSVPPYVVAVVAAVTVAFVSDRIKMRGIFLTGPAIFCITGFIVLRTNPKSLHVKYGAIFLVALGGFSAGSVVLSWCLNNAAGPPVQAVTSAYVVSIGTIGAIIATWAYLPQDGPNFPIGHSINLGAQIGVALVGIVGALYCWRENRVRRAGKRDHRLAGLTEKQATDLGHKHPEFRYIM